ncbi:carbamate kinase [Sansalvadorimonas verongulae]|uniref:carbamate kinase n=1 Tax=Sansalvadorimonas verongulae TaxID=2172824 RepID=UPI0012BC5A2E|nr:carbamate kinase [Sansalvadorimonas verongulae]MTI13945.1 carbamate kinase [Sansalvadorimonas verongulae]
MRIVIALGGNAMLQRGQPLEAGIQRDNIRKAAEVIARVAQKHEVILTHGNGPQVGLLALQNAAYDKVSPYPLDVLGAETAGMIGYMMEQELYNQMPGAQIATLVTQTLVDSNDPAFQNPTKFVGPVYSKEEAEALAAEKGWDVKQDGDYVRRVVPSPLPSSIVEVDMVKKLSDMGALVICSGGGGVPVRKDEEGKLHGVEAVVDKDLTAALMAEQLGADALVIMTDVPAVCVNFGQPDQKEIHKASIQGIGELDFPAGSMGPKIDSCANFVDKGGRFAAIGSLYDVEQIVEGQAGTWITNEVEGISFYDNSAAAEA